MALQLPSNPLKVIFQIVIKNGISALIGVIGFLLLRITVLERFNILLGVILSG